MIRLHQAGPQRQLLKAHFVNVQSLIDEGLHWLESIGKQAWRSGIALHQAEVHECIGEYDKALRLAEEAYQLVKQPHGRCGYHLVDHAVCVARCAVLAGFHARALEVLGEIPESDLCYAARRRVLIERARILRQTKPPRPVEALDAARASAGLSSMGTNTRVRLLIHTELGLCGVAAGSLFEAGDALGLAYALALVDKTDDRRFLLREVLKSLETALGQMPRLSLQTGDVGQVTPLPFSHLTTDLVHKLTTWVANVKLAQSGL
jgi:hypothetical protein